MWVSLVVLLDLLGFLLLMLTPSLCLRVLNVRFPFFLVVCIPTFPVTSAFDFLVTYLTNSSKFVEVIFLL